MIDLLEKNEAFYRINQDLLIKLEKQRKRIEYLEGELREATLQNNSRLIDKMTYFV